MIKYMQYAIQRDSGEVKIPFEREMKMLEAISFVATGVEVGNYGDLSQSVPFTKLVGIDHRRVNDWFNEYEGSEKEILPLFVAAYAVTYIICKGNECSDINKCLEHLPIHGKVNPEVLKILEGLPARELCYPSHRLVNVAIMLASSITNEADIMVAIDLPHQGNSIHPDVYTVVELMAENPKSSFREILQTVS